MNKASFICRLIDSFENNRDKIAVIDQGGKRETTYGELLDMSLRMKGYLEQQALSPHSFVAICLPTSLEYIVAQMGIWLSGHTIVPLGDQFPEERINHIMGHCHAALLLREKEMQAAMLTPAANLGELPQEDNIMALFYTSGSTGTPKGVIHTFRTFDASRFLLDTLGKIQPLVMGMTLKMFFVVSEYMHSVLATGGKVVIVPPDIIQDANLLADYYARHRVTFAFFTPSLLRYFHKKSDDMQLVMVASERVSGIAPDGYRLMNIYGQTETGEGCFMYEIDKAYENTPIGKPTMDQLEYCIMDDDLQEVPQGYEGELCLKGLLSPGYYNAPELTEQLWRGGWLHTGDIVRQQPDGNVVYVNRKDWLLKINGQRVEPGEVEAVIKLAEGVTDAIVKGYESNGHQYLCAYFIAPEHITEDDLRRHLSQKLPEYMIPSYFVRMDHFPLLPNGKTDRQSLPVPTIDNSILSRSAYKAPKNELEETLCKAFQQTLEVKHIGVDDDFFALGGDSISIMKLQELCPQLTLSTQLIYRHRTPAKIAEACLTTTEERMVRQDDYPLSQTQLGIYAKSMARSGERAYNNALLYQLSQQVDLQRLAHACEAVVEAHPYLKTRLYTDDDGNPRQRRNDLDTYSQSVETMSHEEFEQLKPHLMQPFHLLRDRLFRIRIIQTPDAAYLFIDFHHIIFDGSSLAIFLDHLNRAYRNDTLEPETWSGYEVVQQEERMRHTTAYADARRWYLDRYGSLDVVSLPMPDRQSERVTFQRLTLPLPYSKAQLQEVCHRLGVTLSVLTTAAFGYLLGYVNYTCESVFTTVYHGRKDLKTRNTIAMLTKALPVYTKWNESTTVSDLLVQTREQLLGCMANDLYSYAELSAANSFINSRILFVCQDNLDIPEQLCGEPRHLIPLMGNATGEPLAVAVHSYNDMMLVTAEYQSNRYSEQWAAALMDSYVRIINAFSRQTGAISNLQLLTADEERELLAMGTGEPLVYDNTGTFVSQFRRQACLTPQATAVADAYGTLTYSELDRRSDVLATLLTEAGVGQNDFVALMLPRDKEFLTATIAVFKSGGAYVPFDSNYPDERLRYMLADSQARIIVSTRALLNEKTWLANNDTVAVILLDETDLTSTMPSIDNSRTDSLAYMIYTSGSTGNPKGVMVEHKSLRALTAWLPLMVEMHTGDRCAEIASFSFDASLLDLFPPLTCGAEVHILSSDLLRDLKGIFDYLTTHHITGMSVTAKLGVELVNNYDLPLRYMMLGGEKLPVTRTTSVRIINSYGPTEFTVCSSNHTIDPIRHYDNIPIGRPVPNSLSCVIGTSGKLVPRGIIGELCLSGPQIARGYWHHDDLTARHFSPNPYADGQRMYHTGDLVRWNATGELEFIDRIDGQVKLRGYRIELSEVENVLNRYPSVTASAAVIHNQGSIPLLVAYYCASKAIASDKLRLHLEHHLPEYMVPQVLVQLDILPLTPNGKIDTRQLTARPLQSATVLQERVLPANAEEQILFDVACHVLGTDRFGVTDDLTLFGLTSLSAIRMAEMLRRQNHLLRAEDLLRLKNIRDVAHESKTVGHWEGDEDPEKPVVVLVRGVTPQQLLTPLITSLCENYSVYIVDTLDLKLHADFIMAQLSLHPSPHAFIGHSYGGELAYLCADMWRQRTGLTTKVCMLDTYTNVYNNEDLPQTDNEVILFNATQPIDEENLHMPHGINSEEFWELHKDNKQRWQQLVPELKIESIDANHFSMLGASYISLYMKHLLILVLLMLLPFTAVAQTDSELRMYYDKAASCYEIGQLDEALEILSKHVDDFQENLKQDSYRLMSLCCLALDDNSGAEHYAQQLLQVNPYYTSTIQDPIRFTEMIEKLKGGTLATITTASSQAEVAHEAPVPVTIVTREMIDILGNNKNLGHILSTYVPGMSEVNAYAFSNIAMHGIYTSSQEKILIMENGHRLNAHSTNNGRTDYGISTDKIDHIEVLRGPASSLYGNVALTAVVNIITKSGRDINGFRAKYGYGSYNTHRADITLGTTFMGADILAWGSLYASNGERISIPKRTGYANPVRDGYGYVGRYNERPSYDMGCTINFSDFTLQFSRKQAKQVPQYSWYGEIYDYDRYRKIDGVKPGYSTTEMHVSLGYSHQLGKVDISASVYGDWHDNTDYAVVSDSMNNIVITESGTAATDDDGKVISRTFIGTSQVNNWKEHTIGMVARVGIPYVMGSMKGNLLIGTQNEYFRLDANDTFIGEDFDRITTTIKGSEQLVRSGTEKSISFFVQDKHYITSHLIVNAGLRFDSKYRANDVNIKAYSPRVALIYLPSEHFSTHLTYTRAFVDAPYFYRQNSFNSYRGSEDLMPEYMDAIQYNILGELPKLHLVYDINLYYNRLTDIIVNNQSKTLNAPKYINAGRLKVIGIEGELNYKTPTMYARINLAWQRALNAEQYYYSDHTIYSIPDFTVNLASRKRLFHTDNHALWLKGNIKYTSRTLNRANTLLLGSQDFHLDARALVNVGLSYDYKQTIQFTVDCDNVFNTTYHIGGTSYFPYQYPGRTVMGTVAFKF